MLLLSQIYYQQKENVLAKKYALKIVKQVPKYIDAHVLLVRALLANKELIAAKKQIKTSLALSPKDKELKSVALLVEKAFSGEQLQLPKPACMDLIEKDYECRQKCADEVARAANFFYEYKQFHVAAQYAKEALAIDSQNKKAKGVRAEIKGTSKKYLAGLNQFSINTEQDHVSDLDEWWNYTTVAFRRYTSTGTFGAFVNYTKRRGIEGTQEEILLAPILNKYAMLELDVAFSDRFELFPRFMTRVEGFFSIPKIIDFSLGQAYWDLQFTHFHYITGSLTKETAYFYISFRPTHYIPEEGERSTLYLTNLRLYIKKDIDHYIWGVIGFGRSPDLNDLLTANFIVIENRIYYIGYHFPLNKNKVAINIGADYQHQVFPSGRVREIRGGILGIALRF